MRSIYPVGWVNLVPRSALPSLVSLNEVNHPGNSDWIDPQTLPVTTDISVEGYFRAETPC